VPRILVRTAEDDVVLKAALLPSYWSSGPHVRAIPTLLEAIALWHQAPVRAVVSARDVASSTASSTSTRCASSRSSRPARS
jgi:hypothetical protein